MIAVVSGKGGVGKSTVSALLAISLRRQGQLPVDPRLTELADTGRIEDYPRFSSLRWPIVCRPAIKMLQFK
ncbi:MAG: P-loop NTPase [Bacillota bacterium]